MTPKTQVQQLQRASIPNALGLVPTAVKIFEASAAKAPAKGRWRKMDEEEEELDGCKWVCDGLCDAYTYIYLHISLHISTYTYHQLALCGTLFYFFSDRRLWQVHDAKIHKGKRHCSILVG